MSKHPRSRLRMPSLLIALVACLAGTAALAQSAVVLDFKGDRRSRLQRQIETSLRELEGISLLSSSEWDRAARREGLSGARADSARGVATLAPKVGVAVAVSGRVQKTFRVTLVDANGKELSSRSLKLQRGLLSKADLKRLGRAVKAALEVSAAAPAVTAASTGTPPGEDAASAKETERGEPLAALAPPQAPPETDASTARKEDGQRGDRGLLEGPPLVKLVVYGTGTARTQCATPRVDSCAAYKSLEPADRPLGRFVEFTTPIPYAGVGARLELFPLSGQGPESLLQGLGLLASAQRGWSEVSLRHITNGTEVMGPTVHATDDFFSIEATWRFGFTLGGMRAHAGPRGGILWRTFAVDAASEGVLPGSGRRFGAAGVDLGLAISPDLAFELAWAYAFSPTPGADERRRFGEDVDSSGFVLEGGVMGRIAGPLGYHLRLNLMRFADRFNSAGEEWPEGGSISELYAGLQIGLSASF